MNILPKKRWHVRTKENIARVRKDEAEAAEKERQEQLRIENADREARLNVLKQKSKEKLLESGFGTPHSPTSPPLSINEEHINLFSDLSHTAKISNKDHDREVKEKKEEYEKKIGYLTYLGQDTNESLGKKNWYEVAPEASRFMRTNEIKVTYDKLVLKDKEGVPRVQETDVKHGEVAWKAKQRLDPLNKFKAYCFKHKLRADSSKPSEKHENTLLTAIHKNKKHKHKGKEDKDKKIQQLREARLKREQQEKQKTEKFLANLTGKPIETAEKKEIPQKVKPKYNSQFNPELARQNYM